MIRRLLSIALIAWALGFVLFAVTLPRPVGNAGTDGVVVLTGGAGRIDRGLEVLRQGWARRLLVSGVGREVKPGEFAAEYKIGAPLLSCCVTLGYRAVDTRSNGTETAEWVRTGKIASLRLVTSDWHMRRAALELRRSLPASITVVEDAVPTQPNLWILFLEYHKWLARLAAPLWDRN
ncbi:YdcF family protein [Novosphingobium aquiterrae]|uniref:YdcF family protein n=1 Tax=Novosphingobium aquiterrae TaxID=624388 RepID=A0ABV6PKR5_9SPHN